MNKQWGLVVWTTSQKDLCKHHWWKNLDSTVWNILPFIKSQLRAIYHFLYFDKTPLHFTLQRLLEFLLKLIPLSGISFNLCFSSSRSVLLSFTSETQVNIEWKQICENASLHTKASFKKKNNQTNHKCGSSSTCFTVNLYFCLSFSFRNRARYVLNYIFLTWKINRHRQWLAILQTV